MVETNPSSTPFFSIGVTTYNRPGLLKQSLASIVRQTFPDFEVIVGNDYVQEPLSAEALGLTDQRIRIVNNPQNLGEVRNMNALIDLARGRYFTWQTDDDLYAPNFLEAVYSALVRFDFPPCVFTSFEFIEGEDVPDVAPVPSGHGQKLSGRQFLRNYWSGKLAAMGCSGVYSKEHLKRIGGVESLADTSFALYSEHLLLVRAGLLEKLVYIDTPLVKSRIHEGSWGYSFKDLRLYKQASENLVRESVDIFSKPELRDDFRQNIASILEFATREFFSRIRYSAKCWNRLKAVPFLISLRRQFKSLKGSNLYWHALISWCYAATRMIWWLGTRFDFKAATTEGPFRFIRTFRLFRRKKD